MKVFKTVCDSWELDKTTALFGLKIAPGAILSASDGKMLTMTINGVHVDPLPGTYEGDIVLTVTDPIEAGSMAKAALRAAVCIGADGLVPEKSVLSALKSGEVDNSSAHAVTVESRGDCFSAVYFAGGGSYTIDDLKIDFTGNGNNESVGEGAGVVSAAEGTLTLNNAYINISGAARSAIFSGGDSTLIVNDSYIKTTGGVLPHDYEDSIAAGKMKRVPWMLGLRGNTRATNVAERATAVYNRCTLLASEWGVMSTDGVERCRLTLNDCHIGITGKSGYGIFALLDTVNTLNHCTVDVPDYAAIVANGPASTVITNETKIKAGRFGVMCFRNTTGIVTVDKGSVMETGEACFMVKGCSTRFHVDGAVLHPKNGVILQLMDTDDPRNPRKYFVDSEQPDIPNPKRDLTSTVAGVDVIAHFLNMSIAGNFYNSTSNRKHDTGPELSDPHGPPPEGQKGPGGPPPGPKPDEKPGEQAKNMLLDFSSVQLSGVISASAARHTVKRIDKTNCEELGRIVNEPSKAINNGVIVSLRDSSIWEVAGASYITSLSVDTTSSVSAPSGYKPVLYVNNELTQIIPGSTYTGFIMLSCERL